MKKLAFGFVAMALWLGVTSNARAKESLTCPATVRLVSGVVFPEDVPTGFKPIISKSNVRLSGASIFDGPPEQGASLIPVNATEESNFGKWAFYGDTKENVWLSCDYADGFIRLAKHVNKSVSSCTSIAKQPAPKKILSMRFECR